MYKKQYLPLLSINLILGMVACSSEKETNSDIEAEIDTYYEEWDTETGTETSTTESEYAEDYSEMTESEEDTGTEEDIECDEENPVRLFLSPDDSNSMSSAELVKQSVLYGWNSINNIPIRTYEFMNYYNFSYERPNAGQLGIAAEMVQRTDNSEQYDLQIAVVSPELSNANRTPMNITLVLDTSGSMGGTPISLLRKIAATIAGQLKEGDIISMVTWDTSNATVLNSLAVAGPNDPNLMIAIQDISAGGGTDLNGGLMAGYNLAQENFSSNRINRIVLISDGGANAGITDLELIAQNAGSEEEDGIYMVGVGVGTPESYNDTLMNLVTDSGKGAAVFIGNDDEAGMIFGERFVNTMDVAARNVQVALDLPPGFEMVNFSGEEYSTNASEIEPQHLAPNDAMVFLQTIETCAPELLSDDSQITITLKFLDRSSFEAKESVLTYSFSELMNRDLSLLRKGQAIFEYAEGLKSYKLSQSTESLTTAFESLSVAEELNENDQDLIEIRTILEAL